ncbi:MAG: hypothetical protein U0610_31905 [bacterium]
MERRAIIPIFVRAPFAGRIAPRVAPDARASAISAAVMRSARRPAFPTSAARLLRAWLALSALLACGARCAPALAPGVRTQAIVVLPPTSTRLDPLVPQAGSTTREADRRLLVEVVESVAPLAVHDRLVARGVRVVVVRREDLTSAATESLDDIEQRLSYAGLARAHGADRVLRIGFDGSLYRGAGSVEVLGGLIAFDYPSDTSWLELELSATLVDPANPESTQSFSVAGKRHTDVRSLVGGVTDRDRLTALTRDLVDELVDRMLGP